MIAPTRGPNRTSRDIPGQRLAAGDWAGRPCMVRSCARRMAPSIVEKYEQILAADPRSRIFVELAKALVERGDRPARSTSAAAASSTIRPRSSAAWCGAGRSSTPAKPAGRDRDSSRSPSRVDPASPYAYNLVGEALVAKGLHAEALPYLARAARAPAGGRARARDGSSRRGARRGRRMPRRRPPRPSRSVALEDEDDDRTEPYRPLRTGTAARGERGPDRPSGRASRASDVCEGRSGDASRGRADGSSSVEGGRAERYGEPPRTRPFVPSVATPRQRRRGVEGPRPDGRDRSRRQPRRGLRAGARSSGPAQRRPERRSPTAAAAHPAGPAPPPLQPDAVAARCCT